MNGNLTIWKKITMVAGAIGAVLAVMISWQSLEFLPRWAWYSEVASVQSFSEGTRKIVLGQEWERLYNQISRLEAQRALSDAERTLLTQLRWRLREVEAQLKALGQ